MLNHSCSEFSMLFSTPHSPTTIVNPVISWCEEMLNSLSARAGLIYNSESSHKNYCMIWRECCTRRNVWACVVIENNSWYEEYISVLFFQALQNPPKVHLFGTRKQLPWSSVLNKGYFSLFALNELKWYDLWIWLTLT